MWPSTPLFLTTAHGHSWLGQGGYLTNEQPICRQANNPWCSLPLSYYLFVRIWNRWQRKLKMSTYLQRGHELVLGPFRAEQTQVTKKQKLNWQKLRGKEELYRIKERSKPQRTFLSFMQDMPAILVILKFFNCKHMRILEQISFKSHSWSEIIKSGRGGMNAEKVKTKVVSLCWCFALMEVLIVLSKQGAWWGWDTKSSLSEKMDSYSIQKRDITRILINLSLTIVGAPK